MKKLFHYLMLTMWLFPTIPVWALKDLSPSDVWNKREIRLGSVVVNETKTITLKGTLETKGKTCEVFGKVVGGSICEEEAALSVRELYFRTWTDREYDREKERIPVSGTGLKWRYNKWGDCGYVSREHNASFELQISFTPDRLGEYTGTIQFVYNQAEDKGWLSYNWKNNIRTISFEFKASAIEKPLVTFSDDTPIDFGKVPIGASVKHVMKMSTVTTWGDGVIEGIPENLWTSANSNRMFIGEYDPRVGRGAHRDEDPEHHTYKTYIDRNINFTFAPTQVGVFRDTFVVAVLGMDKILIPIAGEGYIYRELTADTNHLDFGEVPASKASEPQKITVTGNSLMVNIAYENMLALPFGNSGNIINPFIVEKDKDWKDATGGTLLVTFAPNIADYSNYNPFYDGHFDATLRIYSNPPFNTDESAKYNDSIVCIDGAQPLYIHLEGQIKSPVVCPAPDSLNVTEVTYNSITLSWNGDNENYQIAWYKENGEPIEDSVIGNTYTIKDLDSETTYFVRLNSICTNGSIGTSEEIEVTTDIKPCPTPTNLQVDGLNEHSVSLSWDVDPENINWNLLYRESNAEKWNIVAVKQPSYLLEELTPNTLYLWQVVAECDRNRISEAIEGEFTTGTEQQPQERLISPEDLKVSATNKIIHILNPKGISISHVQLYDINGTLLTDFPANSKTNILIPTNLNSSTVVVKVYGENENVVSFKVSIK